MCLPFMCGGGGDHSDHGGSTVHEHPPRRPPPHHRPPLSPTPRYDTTSPLQERYDHRSPPGMAAGGGDARTPRYVEGANRNGERMTTAFDNSSHADAPAFAGAFRGRGSAAAEKNVARTPAGQAPAPRRQRDEDVYASPRFHGSSAAAASSHPKESRDNMWAPPVAQMGRRGGEDDYPTAAATTPTPAANNYYGDRDRGYGNNRKPQGNSWW